MSAEDDSSNLKIESNTVRLESEGVHDILFKTIGNCVNR